MYTACMPVHCLRLLNVYLRYLQSMTPKPQQQVPLYKLKTIPQSVTLDFDVSWEWHVAAVTTHTPQECQ